MHSNQVTIHPTDSHRYTADDDDSDDDNDDDDNDDIDDDDSDDDDALYMQLQVRMQ
jgi:hypothetical protein